ncbi:MAG: hypothetical protein LIP23_10245, partial [Planctomycetes bacterium]|nr:hypothetical protein [Planctomycetota bacterium]
DTQPESAVTVQVASASAILEMLLANAIDIALYEGAEPDQRCTAVRIGAYPLTPVCARRHRFAGKAVGVDEFLAEKLLLREPGSAIRDVLDSFLRLRQRSAVPVMTSVNSQAIVQAVRNGMGVSVLPQVIIDQHTREKSIAAFSVKSMRLENAVWILTHRDKFLTPALRAFIRSVKTTPLT